MEFASYESDTSSENEDQDFMLFDCESIDTPPLVGFKKNYRRRRGKQDVSSVHTLETASYSESSALNIWSEPDDSEEDDLARRSVNEEVPSPSSPNWGHLRHRHDAVETEYDRDHTAPLVVYSSTDENMDGSLAGSFSKRKKHPRSKSSKRTFLCLLFIFLFAVVAGLSFIFGTVPVLPSDPKTDENLKRLIHSERAKVLDKIRSSRNAVKNFEILITVPPREYHRNDFLINSLDAHSKCSSVDSVKVLWSGKPSAIPNGVIDHESGKVTVVQSNEAHYEKSKTDAVLLLNDDVIFSCDEITRAFKVWKQSPDRLVGFFPFSHERESRSWTSIGHFGLEEVKAGEGDYTLVSDRAVFVHRLFLGSSNILPSFGGAAVHQPCDSVALSVRVTAISSKPPIAISASPMDLNSSNIVQKLRKNDEQRRNDKSAMCLASW
eukprot:CAMPEP_0198281340 /NCGR_PEP_ID=MMETSP1449-20131203/1310_1 /TAXON_ID=420275 /ORGANISM="Attheya septentrionalis, Strain CCMP2084" /LENGTH=435 /DNA_ID=CAMNT_0043977089 /DNA_START=423 /DNA_END=1727 /DNA_ORIENTATION=+